jgi:hypothetical protein
MWQQQAVKSKTDFDKFLSERFAVLQDEVGDLFHPRATLWYRWIRDEKGNWSWEFNHLEDGHCQNNYPTPKVPLQNQAWKGGKWAKAHVQLNGTSNVVGHYIIY